MTSLEYKGYLGQIELDEDGNQWHGRVVNTRDVLSFYGRTPAELRKELAATVEEYLALCRERGIEPDKPFSGKFLLRVPPDLHKRVAEAALRDGKSLNAWVATLLEESV